MYKGSVHAKHFSYFYFYFFNEKLSAIGTVNVRETMVSLLTKVNPLLNCHKNSRLKLMCHVKWPAVLCSVYC